MFNKISVDDFCRRTSIDLSTSIISSSNVEAIVALRDLVKVLDIRIMPESYLRSLLNSVTLEGHPESLVYYKCEFRRARIDPRNLKVGQTFVLRSNYQNLIENMTKDFDGFCVNHGFVKCSAMLVYGMTADNKLGLAHYVPPIIEAFENDLVLIDGVHRCFLTMSIGTTIESIILYNPNAPLPCW